MRGLRDFDQAPPPADGGRPAGEAAIGAAAGDVEEVEGEPSRPLHRRDAASFYVLEGEVVLTAGERELRAQPGSWVDVPAGVAHMLSFPVPTRFLSLRS